MAVEFGILNIGIKGYEVDDCIGMFFVLFFGEVEIIIVMGDKDLF